MRGGLDVTGGPWLPLAKHLLAHWVAWVAGVEAPRPHRIQLAHPLALPVERVPPEERLTLRAREASRGGSFSMGTMTNAKGLVSFARASWRRSLLRPRLHQCSWARFHTRRRVCPTYRRPVGSGRGRKSNPGFPEGFNVCPVHCRIRAICGAEMHHPTHRLIAPGASPHGLHPGGVVGPRPRPLVSAMPGRLRFVLVVRLGEGRATVITDGGPPVAPRRGASPARALGGRHGGAGDATVQFRTGNPSERSEGRKAVDLSSGSVWMGG